MNLYILSNLGYDDLKIIFILYNFIMFYFMWYFWKGARISQASMNAKSIFLSNMSHEIRTPLNAIIGMGELLTNANLNIEEKNYLKVLQTASSNLLSIINDILDLNKIEAGKIELEDLPFLPNTLVQETINFLIPSAKNKEIELECEIQKDIPYLNGDSIRLRQILVNLISNAIKFTSKGYVKVSVEICQNEEYINKLSSITNRNNDESLSLLFTVKDTGIGIPIDKWDTIFETFTQADPSTTRRFGGTGLGLAITRNLINLMKGHVWVESYENQGTIFYCLLPFSILSSEKEKLWLENNTQKNEKEDMLKNLSNEENEKHKLEILVAEDNLDNQAVMRAYFKNTFHNVTFVDNGKDAVSKFLDKVYDLIFMDIQMPIMDGIEATRNIRTIEKEEKINRKKKEIHTIGDQLESFPMEKAHTKRVPIYALTAHALKQEMEKTQEAGCDGHIVKPLKKTTLFEILSKHAA